jgi:UTP--glucose-1-phosphate uridylyltransferase
MIKPAKKRIKTAIFPVGGLGTRFLPATKSMPKEMLPIANKPIIQYAYEEARDAGIEKFIFITGRNKNAINNHFDHAYELESRLDQTNKDQDLKKVLEWLPSAGQIAFVRQQKPLGLGHAILCARNFISNDEPFIVILADEMMIGKKDKNGCNFLANMIKDYEEKDSKVNYIAVDEVDKNDVNKYGIIKAGDQDTVIDMIEKPSIKDAPSNLAITGRYLLQPEIFEYLAKGKIGSGGEVQLTDAMKDMCVNGDKFYFKKINQQRFDCGSVLGYIEANIAFALKDDTIKNDVIKIISNIKSHL